MNLAACQTLLAAALLDVQCPAPERSCAGQTGRSILRMAQAYESDGRAFHAGNDPVNALAAFLYGFGWLHCGTASGLLVFGDRSHTCPLKERFDLLPSSEHPKRDEKCNRYSHLLATALASVTPAPDPSTPSGIFAREVLVIAGAYLHRGNHERAAHHPEDALACFSYGHGWIDAAVQAGLFAIHANRDIFTVD